MSSLGFTKDSYSRCKNSAIYSLAMREHSRQELKLKLKKKFAKEVDLNKLLDELESSDYLSDQRFSESFIRSCVLRGHGKIKILNNLRQRGVSTSLANISMQQADTDWYALARQIREKKFGKDIPEDYKDKAKQMRFLKGRGFNSEEIKKALKLY